MRHIIIFSALIVSFNLIGQDSYNWINHPSLIGILNEYEDNTRDFKLLEGNVKEIRQISYYTPSKERKVETSVKYSVSGDIQSIQTTITDSLSSSVIRFLSIQFIYDSTNLISNEIITDIFEGDTLNYLDKRIPEWFGPDLPDPISSNTSENPVLIVFEEDTTYSFYDEYGRKIMDSIPYSRNIEGFKYKYVYHTDSIYCDHFWSADSDVPAHKEIFILDQHGNWIEKREIGLFDIPSGNWSAIHRRRIIYY